MTRVAEVLVFGVRDGAILSLVGLGLALVYKSTRILNFAQGELGTAPAFFAFLVMSGFAVDGTANRALLVPATLAAVAMGALLGMLLYLVVIRRLTGASPVTSLVVTAGVFLFLVGVQLIVFEVRGRPFPRFVEGVFGLGFVDVNVTYQTLVVLAVLGAAAAALAVFFRTPMGIALLATAQDPFAAELQGVPVERLRAFSWGAAGAFGAIAGVLAAGIQPALTPGMVTSAVMIPAFIGVILGGLNSMVGAVTGGFAVALIAATAERINSVFELGITGVTQMAWFIVLVVVLVLRPQGLFGEKEMAP